MLQKNCSCQTIQIILHRYAHGRHVAYKSWLTLTDRATCCFTPSRHRAVRKAVIFNDYSATNLLLSLVCNYFASKRGAESCDERVCLSVCPLVYLENHTTELHQIFVHVACGCGSFILRRSCDTLCTSGSMARPVYVYDSTAVPSTCT